MCKQDDRHHKELTESSSLLPSSSSHEDAEIGYANEDVFPSQKKLDASPQRLTFWLTVTVWVSGAVFGSFALLHYLRNYMFLNCNEEVCPIQAAWDRTDPHLYRPSSPIANRMMALHMVGGVFMMLAGPIQFLKYIRQNYTRVHHWMGRLYILAALTASGFAAVWTFIYKTSRCNVHEDYGNYILGGCTFVSAIQTYRYVAIHRDIDQHQLWAWRLYASVLGAPLYRLYAAFYFALVLYTPWEGSEWMESSLFYIIVLPNLAVVQVLWGRKNQNQTPLASSLWIHLVLVFVATSTGVAFFTFWLPSILGVVVNDGQSIATDYCPSR